MTGTITSTNYTDTAPVWWNKCSTCKSGLFNAYSGPVEVTITTVALLGTFGSGIGDSALRGDFVLQLWV